MNKRPLAVTVVGWLYIVVGIGGLASHAGEFKMGDLLEADVIEAVAVQFTAIVAGSFLLRGENWARWPGGCVDRVPRRAERASRMVAIRGSLADRGRDYLSAVPAGCGAIL